jgi:hypothetical protein
MHSPAIILITLTAARISNPTYCHIYVDRNGETVVPKLTLGPRREYASSGAGIAPIFLTSALHGGEWSTSCPGRFRSGESGPRTLWTGSWTDPTAGLEVSGEQSLALPGISPEFLGRSARKLLTILPELSRRVFYTVM